jgi:hypothetical protein
MERADFRVCQGESPNFIFRGPASKAGSVSPVTGRKSSDLMPNASCVMDLTRTSITA